jgi:transcription elongation factor Elf1
MPGKPAKTATKTKKPEPRKVTFLCRRCGKYKPIAEMVTVTRFIPALIVCHDCARELR